MVLEPRKEVQARRLIAQGLAASAARPAWETPLAVVKHLLALQGQNYRAGVRAIALRVNNGAEVSDEAVREAIVAHHIVRAWPLRGTLHFMPAEDARWVSRLCSPRVESGAARRRPGLGFMEGDFERAREALNRHLLNLHTGQVLGRKAAYALFAEAGVNPEQGRGPHLLRALGGLGDVVQGPVQGREETFVHVDRLSTAPREVAEESAAAELASRYIAGHGPVVPEDLCWWAYWTKTMARNAFATAEETIALELDGVEYLMAEWQQDVTEQELQEALERTYKLPAFDEYLLGYADKSFTMTPEIRHEVLTMNGISWDFTVHDGEVVGRTRP